MQVAKITARSVSLVGLGPSLMLAAVLIGPQWPEWRDELVVGACGSVVMALLVEYLNANAHANRNDKPLKHMKHIDRTGDDDL